MEKDHWTGILIFLGILAIALFGGSKGASQKGLFSVPNPTPIQKQKNVEQRKNVEQQIREAQVKVEQLKKDIQAEEVKKTESQYSGRITLAYVNRSKDPAQEYVVIRVNGNATTTIPVTGWTLHSTNTGSTITIPKATYLYFTRTINGENDIYLEPNDTLYLITGISPNGVSFKLNKCSGYLTQFQTFIPYINNNCPAPRNEDLSSIKKIVPNDACLDYIQSFPICRAETKNLPVGWTYECTHFIYDKLNYSSCVNTHKTDKDFFGHDWRVYLKRSEHLWKDRREEIILYDNLGKIVSTLTY